MKHEAAKFVLNPPALAACVIVAVLTACTEPLPPRQLHYAGLWENETTSLLITADGRIEYEAVRGRVTTSLSSPIKRISEDELTAGVLWFEKRFELGDGPVVRDGKMMLEVDGVVLYRREDESGARTGR